MVSLFTVGVSFLSGLYFAMEAPVICRRALLGLFASILDGCDGEVAPLTLRESNSVALARDCLRLLYYLFMFVGMTIGLLRGSGARAIFLWVASWHSAPHELRHDCIATAAADCRGAAGTTSGNWQKGPTAQIESPPFYMARTPSHGAPLLPALRDSVFCAFRMV